MEEVLRKIKDILDTRSADEFVEAFKEGQRASKRDADTDARIAKKILQRACDRDWKDEDLLTTAIIVANALAVSRIQIEMSHPQVCTRKSPHVCTENGSCNGYPKPEQWIVECESTPGVWVRSHDVPGVYPSSLEVQKVIGDFNASFTTWVPRRFRRL